MRKEVVEEEVEDEDAFMRMFVFHVDEKEAGKAAKGGRYTSIEGPGWYWHHDGWVDGPHKTKADAFEDYRRA